MPSVPHADKRSWMLELNTKAVALLLGGCLLLTACGGTTARPLARPTATQRFVAAGDHICTTTLALLSQIHRPKTIEQALHYVPTVLGALHTAVATLGTLKAPSKAHPQLVRALADANQLAAVLAGLLHRLRHGTVEFAQLIAVQHRSMAIRAQLDASFRQAGLPRCAV
jgi:hypothetical protein